MSGWAWFLVGASAQAVVSMLALIRDALAAVREENAG